MKKFLHIAIGIIYILFGIYLWNNTAETLVTYSLYLGLTYLFSAITVTAYVIVQKIKPFPFGSIFATFAIAACLLLLPAISITTILWMFVVVFLAIAAYFLYVTIKDPEKSIFHYIQIAISAFATIYGLYMVFNPILAANTLANTIALFVILNGVSYFLPIKGMVNK